MHATCCQALVAKWVHDGTRIVKYVHGPLALAASSPWHRYDQADAV
jgi:hypothetical protein